MPPPRRGAPARRFAWESSTEAFRNATILAMTSGITLLVALTLFLPGRVLAAEFETPSSSARLTVHTDPGCTSRDEVAARVTGRSSRVHFVEGDSVLSVE